jgi:hypothetical protein
MGKHADSIDSQVLQRIRAWGEGHVFTPVDFLDLGSRNAVDLALSRQARKGTIRKLARGLYDLPSRHPQLGVLAPRVDDVAAALKGRDQVRLQPAGAHAANVLGLSTQVPVRVVFLTDGRSRRVQLGKQQIVLKHTTPRQMATAGRASGMVIQALRWIGKQHVNDRTVATLRRQLSEADKQQLAADIRYAPAWIADVIRSVAEPART